MQNIYEIVSKPVFELKYSSESHVSRANNKSDCTDGIYSIHAIKIVTSYGTVLKINYFLLIIWETFASSQCTIQYNFYQDQVTSLVRNKSIEPI